MAIPLITPQGCFGPTNRIVQTSPLLNSCFQLILFPTFVTLLINFTGLLSYFSSIPSPNKWTTIESFHLVQGYCAHKLVENRVGPVPTRFSTSIRGVRGQVSQNFHWRMPCHSYHKGDILTTRKNNATKKMT